MREIFTTCKTEKQFVYLIYEELVQISKKDGYSLI